MGIDPKSEQSASRLPSLADEKSTRTQHRAVTVRSVLVGSVLVCLVCGLSPYNDYVVANTFMVGSYLPLVMVLVFFVLIVLINAPLHRWAPARALSTPELAVILTMTLVSCALPTQGLLRSFLPMLVAPFRMGSSSQVFWNAFAKLNLPAWMFPVGIEEGRTSPIVGDFYGRVPPGEPIPYWPWVVPLMGWGVFLAGLGATLVALAWLLRTQWGVNERLPFPLAQLQLSLLQPPAPGRALNDLFRSRLFWAALGAVFCVQSLSALRMYWPKYFPEFPLSYDLTNILSQPPLSYLPTYLKRATIYFTLVGVAYFIQARTAFSLWAIYVIEMLFATYWRATVQQEIPAAAWRDQHLGACLIYVAGIAWIGRHYWARVFRGFYARGAETELRGQRVAMVVVVVGIAVMITWLCVVGVQTWMAMLIVLFVLLPHVVTARIVAETGMSYIRSTTVVAQVYTEFPITWLTGRDVFMSGACSSVGAFTTRESLLTFAQHGLRVCNEARVERQRLGLVGVIAWALVLGFVVGTWSSLTCYYSYATPISPREREILNRHSLEVMPNEELVTPLTRFYEGRFTPKTHDPYLHFGIGAVVTGALQLATWRFSAWPFVPVGYVVANAQFIVLSWFSLMIGWGAKVLILKFGGARMFQGSRPVFIGIIFGEALAAGCWLLINLALAWMGYDYQPIRFLPT